MSARLAPHQPMKHAPAGGLVSLALSIVGAVTTWNRGPDFGAAVASHASGTFEALQEVMRRLATAGRHS